MERSSRDHARSDDGGDECREAPSQPEAWRAVTVPLYATAYEVSDRGRVRKTGGTLLAQSLSQAGYPRVRLSGPRSMARVHRLVALAFVPNPLGKPFVNHIDHDRANNAAANLEWCTQAENLAHMTEAGRRAAYWTGKRGPREIVPEDMVRAIRAERASDGPSLAFLAAKHGLSKRTVQRIVNRETYADV